MNFCCPFCVFPQLLWKAIKAEKANKKFHQWWFPAPKFPTNNNSLILLLLLVFQKMLRQKSETFGISWVWNSIWSLYQKVWKYWPKLPMRTMPNLKLWLKIFWFTNNSNQFQRFIKELRLKVFCRWFLYHVRKLKGFCCHHIIKRFLILFWTRTKRSSFLRTNHQIRSRTQPKTFSKSIWILQLRRKNKDKKMENTS